MSTESSNPFDPLKQAVSPDQSSPRNNSNEDGSVSFSPNIPRTGVASLKRHTRATIDDLRDAILNDDFNPHSVASSREVFEQGTRIGGAVVEGFVNGLNTSLIRRRSGAGAELPEGDLQNSTDDNQKRLAAPLLRLSGPDSSNRQNEPDPEKTTIKLIEQEKRLLLTGPSNERQRENHQEKTHTARDIIDAATEFLSGNDTGARANGGKDPLSKKNRYRNDRSDPGIEL